MLHRSSSSLSNTGKALSFLKTTNYHSKKFIENPVDDDSPFFYLITCGALALLDLKYVNKYVPKIEDARQILAYF